MLLNSQSQSPTDLATRKRGDSDYTRGLVLPLPNLLLLVDCCIPNELKSTLRKK